MTVCRRRKDVKGVVRGKILRDSERSELTFSKKPGGRKKGIIDIAREWGEGGLPLKNYTWSRGKVSRIERRELGGAFEKNNHDVRQRKAPEVIKNDTSPS